MSETCDARAESKPLAAHDEINILHEHGCRRNISLVSQHDVLDEQQAHRCWMCSRHRDAGRAAGADVLDELQAQMC